MQLYLTYREKLVLWLRTSWLPSLILVGKIVQTLVEVQEKIFSFLKVGQFTMAHMFQYQLLNKMQKRSTMQNALQEWI